MHHCGKVRKRTAWQDDCCFEKRRNIGGTDINVVSVVVLREHRSLPTSRFLFLLLAMQAHGGEAQPTQTRQIG
jgi:hypothetical protein